MIGRRSVGVIAALAVFSSGCFVRQRSNKEILQRRLYVGDVDLSAKGAFATRVHTSKARVENTWLLDPRTPRFLLLTFRQGLKGSGGVDMKLVVMYSGFNGDGTYRITRDEKTGGADALKTVRLIVDRPGEKTSLYFRPDQACTLRVQDLGKKGSLRCPKLTYKDPKWIDLNVRWTGKKSLPIPKPKAQVSPPAAPPDGDAPSS